MQRGYGEHYLQNLLNQHLVRHLDTASIENLNEGLLFRDGLRFFLYLYIMGYCVFITTKPCSGCSVPYAMLAGGFIGCYFLRAVMVIYNGFYSYVRLKDMAMEVRAYQESLVSPLPACAQTRRHNVC